MNTDELREVIWDYLFSTRTGRTLDEIAAFCGTEPEAIKTATNHEWFKVSANIVTVAYAKGPLKA